MKRICNFQGLFDRIALLVLVGFSICAISCKKSNQGGASAETLQQYFSSASQYTLFNKAMQRAGLDTLLGGSVDYTVFAVTDSGMIQAGYTAASLDTIAIPRLKRQLSYQMVQGSVTSSSIQYFKQVPLITADSGYQGYIEENNFGLFFNGIVISGTDSSLANGVVHELQTMPVAPVGDLIATINSIPSLSDYSYVITQAGYAGVSSGNYLKTATVTQPLTIFIPDNAFYASLGFDNSDAIQQAGQNALATYFYGTSPYFTSDFIGAAQLPIIDNIGNPNTAWFTRDGYGIYYGIFGIATSSPNFQIARANIVCTNGVINTIQPY